MTDSLRKLPQGSSVYASDKSVKKKAVGKPSKEKKPVGLDVFERLFRSAAKDKERVTLKVKENLIKRAKEGLPKQGVASISIEKDIAILRENKKMINNSRLEPHEASGHSQTDYVMPDKSRYSCETIKAKCRRSFPASRTKT